MTDQSVRVLQALVMPADEDLLPLYLAEQTPHGCAQVLDRRAVRVGPGGKVSFCSYFNGFPAGYWHRWTVLDEVRLRLRIEGAGLVEVFRSDAAMSVSLVESHAVRDG